MSNKESDKNAVTTEPATTIDTTKEQLDLLKGIALSLGISHSPNIGLVALNEKIKEFSNELKYKPKVEPLKAVTREPTQGEIVAALVKTATTLHRVIITCMNPNKKNWPGEIFTASSSFVPTQKKYVPFNNEHGWHVPRIILNMIKERQCQMFKRTRDSKGREKVDSYLIPEFSIQMMEPLTAKELDHLAKKQTAARSIE